MQIWACRGAWWYGGQPWFASETPRTRKQKKKKPAISMFFFPSDFPMDFAGDSYEQPGKPRTIFSTLEWEQTGLSTITGPQNPSGFAEREGFQPENARRWGRSMFSLPETREPSSRRGLMPGPVWPFPRTRQWRSVFQGLPFFNGRENLEAWHYCRCQELSSRKRGLPVTPQATSQIRMPPEKTPTPVSLGKREHPPRPRK